MYDGDGYTHNISPINKQNKYKYLVNKSDCYDGRKHLNDIINNYNQNRNEYSNNDKIIFNDDGNTTTTDGIDGSMTGNITNRMRNIIQLQLLQQLVITQIIIIVIYLMIVIELIMI